MACSNWPRLTTFSFSYDLVVFLGDGSVEKNIPFAMAWFESNLIYTK